MQIKEISSFEKLYHFLHQVDFDTLIKDLANYDKDYENHYKNYKKIFIIKLKEEKNYKSLLWNLYLKRLFPPKYLKKIRNIEISNMEYFDRRPFWYQFNEKAYATVFSNDSNGLCGTFEEAREDVFCNIQEYKDLHDTKLQDEISKIVLFNILMYRLTKHKSYILKIWDVKNKQYFDQSIIKCNKEEIFVDCGGYTGDTTQQYIALYKKFKKIYIYEPDLVNYHKACGYLRKYLNHKKIEIYQYGVSDKSGIAYFTNNGDHSSNIIDTISRDNDCIEVTTLDEHIKEKISFLKMDVEGEELKALYGAKKHIIKDNPKLAICVYHRINDLLKITSYIHTLNSSYRFYLRHYSPYSWDTILYCIPTI